MATLGLIGSGHIGGTLARLAVDAGLDVVLSNSRGPQTLSDLVEVRLAVEAVRAISDLPIVTTLAFTEEHVTYLGRSPVEVARALRALPVQAIGANCSVGSSVGRAYSPRPTRVSCP